MAGNDLYAFDSDGKIIRVFTPAELGDNIYSVAIFDADVYGGGDADGMPGGCAAGAGGFAAFVSLGALLYGRKQR
jgi:hypothetical protein